MRRTLWLLAITYSLTSGCTMLEYMAPHQLWKLNRQPSLGDEDAYFCIPAEPDSPSRQSLNASAPADDAAADRIAVNDVSPPAPR